MKILFCNYEYPPLGGGGGVVMAALARQLARRHEVTVITSRAGELPQIGDDQGVRVIRVPVFFRKQLAVANFPSMLAYLPTGFLRGWALSRRQQFDVINTHFVVPTGPLGHALSRWRGIPNVLSVHGGDLFDPSKASSPHRHAPLRAAVRSMLLAADEVIGQSRDTVRHVRDIYGVARRVGLIPLGIDRPPQQTQGTRAQWDLPEEAFVMSTVGRLVARKSTVQLIEIMAALKNPKSYLLVVGDGPDADAIRSKAAQLGVADRLRMLGMCSDTEKYAALSVSDLFVSASQHEGFGLVFLEAMAFGVPVVCYERGGQTDFLKMGETGAVIKLNDQQAMIAAIDRLAADQDSRARISKHNLRLVEDYFIDTCAARYEAVFNDIIERRANAQSRSRAVSAS
ncbi:MAG TPA: glycosyltransferase family 4 protein [Steroidobacteraceae bacterium]|nr:glycosyltransferase family 4 protein [Steroidobacteraceae bacterium]